MLVVGMFTLASCSSDDDEEQSPLVGTWTKQVQWADTDGTRDQSFIFYSNGKGAIKSWDWLNQRYVNQNFEWSSNNTTITLKMEEREGGGYVSGIRYYTLTSNCLTLYFSDGDLDGNYFK